MVHVTTLPLALHILQSLDIAVLVRTGPGSYEFFGNPPPFYQKMFPESQGKPCSTPWEHSDMLAFFLDDAEQLFMSGVPGQISSGVWQEPGVSDNEALLATAVFHENIQVILIRKIGPEYVERAHVLQMAREHLLERRRLSSDLALYRQKARFDSLTVLHNRESFFELLQMMLHAARTAKTPFALLLLDIDNFKAINDTYGHLAGDTVLSSLGKLLRSHLRRSDVACRYGGEEFTILAQRAEVEQASRMAEKICARVASYKFADLPINVTVSVGFSIYVPGDNDESIIQRADAALYDAKRQGKNCVRFR